MRDAILKALYTLLDRLEGPVTVTITDWTGAHVATFHLPAPSHAGAPAPGPPQAVPAAPVPSPPVPLHEDDGGPRAAVLTILQGAGRHLTTAQILTEVARRGWRHGERTVRGMLEALLADGTLTRDVRARTIFYGIAGAEDKPAPPPPAPAAPPRAPTKAKETPVTGEQLVSLDQAAALCNRQLKAVESKPDLPTPTVPASGDQPALYSWQALRPWLEGTFRKALPEKFPGD